MTNKIIIFCIICLFTTTVFGQINIDQLLSKADSSYFDYSDYTSALDSYKQIQNQIDSTHKDFGYTVDKIARTLFYLEMEAREKGEILKSIELSREFIDISNDYPKFINESVLEKKYFMVKNIIVGYFALDEKENAKPFQDVLYAAYKAKELPDGIDKYYNFEMFKWNDLNVWGYEWYPQLGDPETKRSFAKHIYYIYTTDDEGNDKDQLYTLQTIKIHKREIAPPYYVLTKRTYLKQGENSETIWSYTFDNPINYEKLHDAIIEYLKGKVESDTESEVKYGEGAKIKIK